MSHVTVLMLMSCHGAVLIHVGSSTRIALTCDVDVPIPATSPGEIATINRTSIQVHFRTRMHVFGSVRLGFCERQANEETAGLT